MPRIEKSWTRFGVISNSITVSPSHSASGAPFGASGFEDHDAFVLVREPQLFLGADHPLRANAADRARLQRAIDLPFGVTVDQRAPASARATICPARCWRAGDDPQPMLAGIDRRQDQAIRVGVRLDRFDVTDVDLVPAIADDR